MSTFNESILLGHLGNVPEVLKTSETGEATFVRCSIATNDKYRDQNGELKENTDWNTVYFSHNQAKVAAAYLTKGDKILAVGKLRTVSKEDEHGVKRYYTGVYVRTLKILSYKQKENSKPDEVETLPEQAATDVLF